MVAEWEPAWGTLIRLPLGIPSDLVVKLAEDDSLYVLVESYYERDQAINTFSSWGVNVSHCRFLFSPTYSHWTRDWGPHYVFNEQGIAGIADPVFNGYPWVPGCPSDKITIEGNHRQRKGIRGWEEDDAVNMAVADSFNCPLIDLPVYLTGGNIMVDGHHNAFSTQQMLDENLPVANEELFREFANDSLGITDYFIADNPEIFGIQHIDCYAKLINEETILVKQVDDWHPEYECCEMLAGQLGSQTNCWGESYDIIRIYCGPYNGTEVAAYTNSLILNKKVLVPLFDISSDESAIQTYSDAMPGYEVIGFNWEGWYYYDALHCRTMGIFDRHMLRIVHKPLKGDIQAAETIEIIALIDDRSEAGLVDDELLVYWRGQGSTVWNTSGFQPMGGTDSLSAFIPGTMTGQTIEYYISASDLSGRHEAMPRTAPDAFYQFTITDTISRIEQKIRDDNFLKVYPVPFSDELKIKADVTECKPYTLKINDLNGKNVFTESGEYLAGNKFMLQWNGINSFGQEVADGVYFIQLTLSDKIYSQKIIKKKEY
jgi:agmatine/peptidylarginine deiminase